VQDGAAAQQLGWFALVFSPFGQKINGFLAGNFQANGFESGVHH
jgi:hypothetical protein